MSGLDAALARIEKEITEKLQKQITLEEEIDDFAVQMARKLLGNSHGVACGEFHDQKYTFSASSSIRPDTNVIVVQVRMLYERDDCDSLISKFKQTRASAEFDSRKSMQEFTSELISVLLYQRYGLPLETAGEEEEE